jgi:multidrug efflux system outer membrane protein
MMRRLLPLILLVTGCNLAPRKFMPELDMPASYRFADNEEDTCANVRWWEQLGDPILTALIETALENNRDLQTAIWRVKEYWGQYQVARSALFPQINFTANAYKTKLPTNAVLTQFLPGINPEFANYSPLINLSYEFDFWGQQRNLSYAAFAEYAAQIENRRTVVLTLIGAVAQAYMTLRQLDEQLVISRETLRSRADSLKLQTDRYQGGVISEMDVSQAESAYQEAWVAIEQLQLQIPVQENLLSVLIGQNPEPIVRGKKVDEWPLPFSVPTGLPLDLLARRPDIIAAENLLIASNANIGVARANFLPQINLTSFYGWDSAHLNTLFTQSARTWQVGGTLLEQIFTGGRLFGTLHVAKAQQKEALFHYEQTILNALAEVNNALITFEKSKQIYVSYTADVEALQQYLHLAVLRYNEGETDYLTVLDAERTLFSALLSQIQAQAEQFLALVNLYKALGGGWVVDADGCLTPHPPDGR